MDAATINGNISLTIDEKLFYTLEKHLFPGDEDEHGAVIAASLSTSKGGMRLLARELFLAKDGVDYVPGTRGYRALTAQFVAEKSDYCLEKGLCYVAIHCHPGRNGNEVRFSQDDINSQKRGYPALVQLTGKPVTALVFANNAVAGNLWTSHKTLELINITIIGSHVKKLYPTLPTHSGSTNMIYDRHARLFGEEGQDILSKLKVGIIGLGGGGSLLNEWISRLGVGHIIAIDFDKVEPSNLPRIVGATSWDAKTWLTNSNFRILRKLGGIFSRYKVHVAKRVAKKANPNIIYDAVIGSILDEETALKIKDVDFIFLASDTISSRNVFNAILHQYLIPGAQIGCKVRTNLETKEIIEVFTASRLVLPYSEGGCLYCNGWIPSTRLQKELLTVEERKAQKYVEDEDVHEPSVITLNVLSAAQIVNDFLMMFTGLYSKQMKMAHFLNDVLNRELNSAELVQQKDCLYCTTNNKSRFAKGDLVRLPCKLKNLKK